MSIPRFWPNIIRAGRLAAAMVLAAGILGAGLALSGPAAPALAASCSGNGCTHQDPQATGCSSDAQTSGPVVPIGKLGTVELRWSARCQANWSRVIVFNGISFTDFWAVVQRYSDGVYDQRNYVSRGPKDWSFMVYAPGCAKAYGQIDQNGVQTYAYAYQPGCSH